MDNTQNPVVKSPIPDLFNTEPEAVPVTTETENSENNQTDIPENANDTGENIDIDESISGGGDETATDEIETTASILGEISALSGQIQSLEKLFNAKILHSEHEKKIVDQMHRELQKYKDDMYAQLIRPILLDIIAMRDSMLKQLSEHKRKPEGEQHIPLQMFETYAFDTEEILEKNSIAIYKSDADSDFVPIRQRAIKKVPTDNQSLHGKVAESIGDGYSYLDKTISPEKVAVYVYEQKQEQSMENEGEENQNG